MFATSNTVGDYAKKYFPDGTGILFDASDFNGMISKTRQLIDDGVDTLYEGTFKYKGIFAMADILHKTAKGWDMIEVKASTSVKPYHIDDAAIQWHALIDAIQALPTLSLIELESMGLPSDWLIALRQVIDETGNELSVVVACLGSILDSKYGELISRHAKRLITMSVRRFNDLDVASHSGLD